MLQPEAIVDFNSLNHNYSTIKARVGSSKIMAVIKADAYGHGAIHIAKALTKVGAHGFCVALVQEAKELLESNINNPVLHLGSLSDSSLEIYKSGQVRCTISSLEDIQSLEKSKLTKIIAHLKVDTGMGRLGYDYQDLELILNILQKSKKIKVEGVYSHFATAEDINTTYRDLQLKRFNKSILLVKKILSDVKYFHIANSAAILNCKESHFNMVRPGITMYGVSPLGYPDSTLKPVLTLKAKVALVKSFKTNSSIGYGRLYITRQIENIATLQIGYADGIPIKYFNGGEVEINDQLFPLVGKVSMDLSTIKCFDSKLNKGDEATFWGGENMNLRLENIAKMFDMIPYELLTGLSMRVKRTYINA